MKRILSVLLALGVVSSAFAGGARSSDSGSQATSGGNPVLTLTTMYFTAEVPETLEVTQKIQDITGYKVNINWIPNTAYEDKINTMMASDSLTQMVIPGELKGTAYLNAVDDGLFWALNDYIKDYPNLVKVGDARYNNVKRNGKIMGIPRGRDLVRQGMIYRQDWAEALGITGQPKTFADLDKMVRGFAARSESRYGLVMGCAGINPAVPQAVDYLSIYFGAPQNYGYDKSGKFTHAWLTDEYTKAVEQFRTWYAAGLINRNFLELSHSDSRKLFSTEEGGFGFMTVDDLPNTFGDLYIKNPNARLWYAMQIDGVTFGTAGFNSAIAVSKTAVKDEGLLRHCLSFINNMGKPEYQALILSGLEGETYSVVDGYAVRNEAQTAKFNSFAPGYSQVNCFVGIVNNPLPAKLIPAMEAAAEERLRYVSTCVMDPTTPFTSPTAVKIGVSDLDPIRCDAINKYIMGTIDKAAYQTAQRRWLEAGGTQVIKEFEDQVKANR